METEGSEGHIPLIVKHVNLLKYAAVKLDILYKMNSNIHSSPGGMIMVH